MSKKTQIILQGRNGRMGREIEALLRTHATAQLIEGDLDSSHPTEGSVVVDFSSPEGMREAIAWCLNKKTAFLSGTTGISAADEVQLRAAGKKIPVLWSPNMSVGVNLFLKMIQTLGKSLRHFDLQIEEAHHAKKKDSPSGTAKILQAAVEKAAKVKMPPVLASRGGGIVGVHKLLIMADEEVLTIEHTALNRAVFARGAISAAVWLSKQKPGLYSMQDVLSE